MEQIPQVFPGAIRIYPSSPQDVPHEFFSFQLPSTTPTSKTMVFIFVVQSEKTPPL